MSSRESSTTASLSKKEKLVEETRDTKMEGKLILHLNEW